MLGDAVRGYTEAAKLLDAAAPWPDDARGALAAWLARCPNPSALHTSSAERMKARRKALHDLSEARNFVAHPRSGDDGTPGSANHPPELEPHWQVIVAEPADAFFRYFPALFDPSEPSS